MKKLLFAFSLLVTLSLLAYPGNHSSTCSVNQPCHESTCGCSTSPPPTTPKCIDCECYTPKYYDLQSAYDVFLRGDFLYWYARETSLTYAQRFTVKSTQPALLPSQLTESFIAFPKEYDSLNAKWNPGLRIGLGFNGTCDGWDLSTDWTYYRNSSSKSSSAPFEGNLSFPIEGQQALSNPWVDNAFFLVMPDTPFFNEKISASWRLTFNQIDLTLGRKYWLSDCFSLRPFGALRGVWTATHFNVNGFFGPKTLTPTDPMVDPSLTNFIFNTKDKFQNRYWGIGFLLGLEPNWHFSRCFSLYADLDAALVWGEFEGKKHEKYLNTLDFGGIPTIAQQVNNKIKGEKFTRMLPILDVGIGVRWEDTYCCNRYRIALNIGWEHHSLFHAGLRHKNEDSKFVVINQTSVTNERLFNFARNFIEVESDIHMGGLVARLQFNF